MRRLQADVPNLMYQVYSDDILLFLDSPSDIGKVITSIIKHLKIYGLRLELDDSKKFKIIR